MAFHVDTRYPQPSQYPTSDAYERAVAAYHAQAQGLQPTAPAVPAHVGTACGEHCWHHLRSTAPCCWRCCWCGQHRGLQHGPYAPQ